MNSSIHNEEEETDESLRPKPTKRIKLEHIVDTSNQNETSKTTSIQTTTSIQQQSIQSITTATPKDTYSKEELIDYFEAEYTKKREFYIDKLLELFFLEENGGSMPDYYSWRRKSPTNALLQYFKQVAKNNEIEFEDLQYDKAKLDQLHNLPSLKILPLSQLKPPNETTATSQTNQNQQQNNLIGGNIVGTPNQQLQPTQSSLTISTSTNNSTSLSYTSVNANNSSSTHLNTTSQFTPSFISSKSTVNNQQFPPSKHVNSSFNTPYHSHHASQNRFPSFHSSSASISHHPIGNKSLPVTPIGQGIKKSTRYNHPLSFGPSLSKTTSANISSVYESSIGSKEQIVERAKQEAYVMQRISELRKEGLWSAKRLPRLQEPTREKAHWDYLLEEMTWLATDFAQERKWKKANAKKCGRLVLKYHQDKESQVEKAEKENLMRLKKIASTISKEIRQFWSSVEKLVDFKMQTKLEEKRKKALDLHLNFIVGQTEKYSSWLAEGLNKNPSSVDQCPDEEDENSNEAADETVEDKRSKVSSENVNLEKNDQEFNVSDDQDESDFEDTIAEQERVENKQQNAEELKDLQNEAEMPIEDLLKWYTEMETNKSEDFDDESMDEEEFDESEDQEEEDDETMNESEDQTDNESEKEEIGVEYLVKMDTSETSEVSF